MINKRLKFKQNIFFYIFILSISLVSCSSIDNTTYIEGSLSKASNYINDKEFDKAIELYDKNLERDPLNTKTLYNKAAVLNYLNESDEALEITNSLIENYPYNIKAYQLKIDILSKLNDSENIIKTYTSLLDLSPYLYSIRGDFITYLLSINEEEDYSSLIKENALFLLEKNELPLIALKALCTIEKNNAEYSALLLLHDEKAWKEIYSQSN